MKFFPRSTVLFVVLISWVDVSQAVSEEEGQAIRDIHRGAGAWAVG